MTTKKIYILGIESSCDDTSASVICDGIVLSNIVANQEIHAKYGGVVPELASRAHQQHIVPVVQQAIEQAGITKEDLHAISFTKGPGLMGSLLASWYIICKIISFRFRHPIDRCKSYASTYSSSFYRRERY
jgi:N6-L-threonylcarbamoyladenine synthase